MSSIGPLVSRSIVRASAEDSVQSAIQLMNEQNVGAILIMAGDSLEAIFTERDVMRRVLAKGLDPIGTPLKDVATPAPITITEGASIKECAYLIWEKHCRHIPVLDAGGGVIGMISARDFLAELAKGFERALEHVRSTGDVEDFDDYYQFVIGTFVD